jgi:Pentapeptide repeats (9 copies)
MSDADKPELRQANDNPWYCLATLHGEQAAGEHSDELAAKNRKAWNRWIAGALSEKQRTELVKNGFPEPELAPLSHEEKSAFYSAFAVRTGRENELPPEPAHDHADFSHTHFDRGVAFGGFLFARLPDFSSATFSNAALFFSATFSDNVNFVSATFSKLANFSSATFSSDALFFSAKFSNRGAYFRLATFSSDADFSSATFDASDFRSATFSDTVKFRLATFSKLANFSSATFSNTANFSSATFSSDAYFRSATFSAAAAFHSATFSNSADFVNAKFAAHTIFAGAGFETHVPDFRGATMHDATEWHGVSWPKPSRDKDAAQAQVYAYERLKQEMERLKKHEDEQHFFRRELRARRGLIRPWSGAGLLNLLYEASSDYGHSINRPLLCFFWLFALGSSVLTETSAFNGAPMTVPNAAKHSFANIFPFLPLKREMMAADIAAGLSQAAQVIAVAQSLLGPLLLFLLGLALRNRFRMR